MGRFFAVHDASHTPGHISLYDEGRKLLLAGDLTVEVNPPFLYSDLERCIEMCGRFKRMAEEGYVELASDSHRSVTFFAPLYEKYGMEPVDGIQLVDVARGGEECVAFFACFEDYYHRLRREVLASHSRIGEATVPEILEEFCSSRDPAVLLKAAMRFPDFPNRNDVLVARVLKESGAPRRREGERVLFAPAT